MVSAYFSTLAFLSMKTGLIWAAHARRLRFFVNSGRLEHRSRLGSPSSLWKESRGVRVAMHPA
jgi:hypothetical protein